MSNSMPKTKKKSNINYSKIAKELKGKTSFKIDLRKSDSNSKIKYRESAYNFGEKMALLKAWREYKAYRTSTNLIEIKRVKGESKTAFNKRLSQTKRDMGQQGTHFKGVWTDTKRYSVTKTKRIKNNSGKYTTQISSTTLVKDGLLQTELWIPLDPIEFSKRPKTEMNRIKKENKGYNFIQPVHSGFRGTGSGMEDKGDWQRFKNKINKWAHQYSQIEDKKHHWLTGFLMVEFHDKKGKKVTTKNKKQKVNSKGRNV